MTEVSTGFGGFNGFGGSSGAREQQAVATQHRFFGVNNGKQNTPD
jgi:hypothetical protein